MAGNPPEYDADHPPPQWPRLYRPAGEVPGDDPLDPASVPGALGLDAANQELDHLGKIGISVPMIFSESPSPGSSHTMTEYMPEKHIYIVHFLWGNTDELGVDGFNADYWDAFIALQTRIREQMLRDFNVFVWIHFVVYPVMIYAHASKFTRMFVSPNWIPDPRPPGGPWHKWKTWKFVPDNREGTDFDLPDWCSVNEIMEERSLSSSDILAGITAATALGGPGLEAGRTGVGIVNSYPTFNDADETGYYVVDPDDLASWPTFPPVPSTTDIPQTFVTDRNTALGSLNGQDAISQADTRPAVVDFSARGSGVNQSLLDEYGSEYYRERGKNIRVAPNNFGINDFHGNGPGDPAFFPYPHPKANYFHYLCSNFQDGGYFGRDTSGWMAGSTVHFYSREGFFKDVNVEVNNSEPVTLSDVTRLCNYDGIIGEIAVYVGSGALNGNAFGRHRADHNHPCEALPSATTWPERDVYLGSNPPAQNYITDTEHKPTLDGGQNTITRGSYHAAIMAAQVIWQDHMGAPPFALRAPPVKNLAVTSTGVHLDLDRHDRENNPSKSPPHEGLIERPYAEIFFNGCFKTTAPLLDSPLHGKLGTMQSHSAQATDEGGYQRWNGVGSSTQDDRMTMWEFRWALSEQTILDGGGTRVNYVGPSTGNQFSQFGGTLILHPGSGNWCPVSHGQNEPTEVFFTVVAYGLFDHWDYLTSILNLDKGRIALGKMILKQFNSQRQWSPGTVFNPLPFINPTPYPRSNLDTRNVRDNDFLNVTGPYSEEIVVVSAMLPADPEASP